MGFFDRISRGWELTKASFGVLKQDKEMILYPLISAVVLLLVAASFMFTGFTMGLFASVAGQGAADATLYVLAFGFYLLAYFVIIYFNTALVSSAMIRFDGRNPTLGDGFKGANQRLPQILGWALVAATVGLILNAISRSRHPLARAIGWIGGLAWSVLTYFVVPILVVEGTGPFQSIKRSGAVMKQTWGEAGTGYISTNFIFMMLGLLGAVILFLAPPALIVPVLVVVVVYWLLLALVASTVSQILNAALYHYATKGTIPGEFRGQEGLIQNPAPQSPPSGGIAGY